MQREGLVDEITENMIFHTVDEAVHALNET
jgi:hypothetical protein